ncbi:MAG: iron ABC transporter permease [Leptospira sp.]|nr:iron ABC transporter permease [Leptospira sp.]
MEINRLTKRKCLLIFSVSILFLSVPIVSIIGAYNISLMALLNDTQSIQNEIFWNIRLPRVILAILLGGSLAWSGAVIQGIFRNPIVDPGLVGITAGASLFAGIGIVLGNYLPFLPTIWSTILFSFVGGITTGFLIFSFARNNGKTEVFGLLLIGIAINALCYSAIGLLTYIANDAQLRNLSSWNLGSLGGASWTSLSRFGIFLILPFLFSPLLYKKLNVFCLGEREAEHLGISVEVLKRSILLLVGVSVGASVALAGNISFIGVMIPHMIRFVIGQDYKFMLPISYILGGTILAIGDAICRTILSPSEIPVGIVTAIMGAPTFLILLKKSRGNSL